LGLDTITIDEYPIVALEILDNPSAERILRDSGVLARYIVMAENNVTIYASTECYAGRANESLFSALGA
jgi:hypothetical protein